MREVVGRCQVLDGLVAHEITMRLALIDVTVSNLATAVNGIVVTHEQWQPPRRASDALLLDAQCTLRCGRVERRRAVHEALGCVGRTGCLEGILHGSELVVIVLERPTLLSVGRVGPAADSLGSAESDLCRTG